MRIFFSVGEPSGDLHGANLIRELQDRGPWKFAGLGGPLMQSAGCRLLHDMTELAVMGFVGVLRHVPRLWRLLQQVKADWDAARPDAVVLIDYPGFNWHVAAAAKSRGIPVYYYGVPQMWAWGAWRIGKMRRLVDHVLCKLPFEQAWYESRGCRATYVGHPYFDELATRRLDASFLNQQRSRPEPLITLLPGSRRRELEDNLPAFAKTAEIIRRRETNVRFAVACLNEAHAALARSILGEQGANFQIHANRTAELIEAAHVCLACSGSVSLELLHHEKPSIIHYRVGRLKYWLLKRLVQVRYVTLVNLLAMEDRFGKEVYDADAGDAAPFPEYPTYLDKSESMAAWALTWLRDRPAYEARCDRLRRLKQAIATCGATRTAAEYLVRTLSTVAPVRSAA